ncbi:hypothetical protein CEW81_18340 [Kluyvera genomosp. 3]|uniref:Uncharacterized protein n=1 Tax=Kluyvera genomosp. 3 TaxID=2774055 RepID=A0A248KJU0_9ENTR|nr:hypothetical protein CEW81_18340 [Kluyvera genomosp. 3]
MADETNNVPANGATFDVGSAFFGTAAAPEVIESDENGAGAQPDSGEAAAELTPVDGVEDAGDAGEGEEVTPQVWEFNGAQFTDEQVSAALKHQETYERFNTTITPLIENIKQFGQTAERLQIMGRQKPKSRLRSYKIDCVPASWIPASTSKHIRCYRRQSYEWRRLTKPLNRKRLAASRR